ncbi:Structure-specific endonuclease ERCC1-XPF, ERCC1 component, partial [Pseudoloma neurophilia]
MLKKFNSCHHSQKKSTKMQIHICRTPSTRRKMVIKVNAHQEGNNVLDHLTQVRWTFHDDLTTDYEIEDFISVLFLSLKFHTFKPEYIISRINGLKKYKVQILLILIDQKNYEDYLEEFVLFDQQIFYCFSNNEAAKYLLALDSNARKPADLLKPKYSQLQSERKQEFLSEFPSLNKNDLKLVDSISLYDFFIDEKYNYKKQKITNL